MTCRAKTATRDAASHDVADAAHKPAPAGSRNDHKGLNRRTPYWTRDTQQMIEVADEAAVDEAGLRLNDVHSSHRADRPAVIADGERECRCSSTPRSC